nr:MAG TPA: Post-transcriptional regulator [Caudoviricetes sp.]DAJ55843.1 MAG TPA: Post-transcriptional regulator [Caudoviricetes sp.]
MRLLRLLGYDYCTRSDIQKYAEKCTQKFTLLHRKTSSDLR